MFRQSAPAALISIALCITAEAKILIGDVVRVTGGDTEIREMKAFLN